MFVFTLIGNLFDSDESKKEKESERIAAEQDEKEDTEKNEKPNMKIELEITETDIGEKEVTVKGKTNLIDGSILTYQLRGTEGVAEVKDEKWEIIETVSVLEE